MKISYDLDVIRESISLSCSVEASFQIPSEKLQPCQKVHKDVKKIKLALNHGVEMDKFEW